MDINEFTRKFHEFEQKHVRPEDWEIWDTVRFEVSYALFYPASTNHVKKRKSLSGIIHHGRFLFRYLIARFRRSGFIFFSSSRFQNQRKWQYDPNIEDVYRLVEGRKICFETFLSTNRYQLPVIFDYALLVKHKLRNSSYKAKYAGRFPCYLTERIETEFGKRVDPDFIAGLMARFEIEKQHYTKMFRRVRPRAVFLIQNGMQKGMLAAARDCGIPVIELQHGLVDFSHLAYSYPPGIDTSKLILPAYFFVYSQFWKNRIHYPVKEIVVTGNTAASVIEKAHPEYDLTIIAADIYMAELFSFTDGLLAAGYKGKICLKLHPNQGGETGFIRNKYKAYPEVEIIYTETSMKKVIAQSRAMLAIQSTSIYEALDAGVPVYILTKLDYKIHADIFEHPSVCLVNSPSEFLGKQQTFRHGAGHGRFFEPFDAEKTRSFLEQHVTR